jgi:hypothetical protein
MEAQGEQEFRNCWGGKREKVGKVQFSGGHRAQGNSGDSIIW